MHHRHRGGPPHTAARHRGDFGPQFEYGPPPFVRGGFGPSLARRPQGRGGPGRRAPRGDIRVAILLLLHERPMHGYEIITELHERTNGLWRPSSGSIYPTLSLLEDEGLVQSSEIDGKRRYSLTATGSEQIANRADKPTPWDEITANADPQATSLQKSGMLLFAALVQVGRAGTRQQIEEAITTLDETRRRLYGLLAEPNES